MRAEQAERLAADVDEELARQRRIVAESLQRADAAHLQREPEAQKPMMPIE